MFKKILLVLFLLFSLAFVAFADKYYEVEVDNTNQIVTVYKSSDRSEESIVRQMVCSTGRNEGTPKGTFKVFTRPNTDRKEWYYIKYYTAYVQYATRFYDDYMFHSIPYKARDLDSIDQAALKQLGSAASHGCIRLLSEDAKWMSENILDGCKVHIYNTKENLEWLKKRLLKNRFSIDDGWADYREFLGYSDRMDAVSYNSPAGDVKALQRLLRGYGYYEGAIDGVLTESIMGLVFDMQEALGLFPTGLADDAFRAALSANPLPAGTKATLESGISGPAVRELQKAMSTLGYYVGEIDGEYSDALIESIRLYRVINHLPEDDRSDEHFQKRVISEAANLNIPEGARLVISEIEIDMVSVEEGIVLAVRRTASGEGKLIGYAKPEDEIYFLEEAGPRWARVRVGKVEGYVMSQYLTHYTKAELVASYE